MRMFESTSYINSGGTSEMVDGRRLTGSSRHPPAQTAQNRVYEIMNGSTEFTLSPDPSQGSGCEGSEGLTHGWNPRIARPSSTRGSRGIGIAVP
jgi:hypothetical protein